MSNSFKTALLLGLLTGIILGVGQLFGGSQGLVIAFVFAGAGQFWELLVFRQDRPRHVSGARGRPR